MSGRRSESHGLAAAGEVCGSVLHVSFLPRLAGLTCATVARDTGMPQRIDVIRAALKSPFVGSPVRSVCSESHSHGMVWGSLLKRRCSMQLPRQILIYRSNMRHVTTGPWTGKEEGVYSAYSQ